MATTNEIGALIAAWFESAPKGIFGASKKDPAVVEWLDTAIAIVLAESGGDPIAKNSGSSASGLWQVMYSLHAGKTDEATKTVEAQTGDENLNVFDPRVNTLVASMIYQNAGRKWTPWETYNEGTYKNFKGKGNAVYDWLNDPARVKAGTDKLLEDIELIAEPDKEIGQRLLDAAGKALDAKDALTNTTGKVMAFAREAGVTIGVFLIALVALILGVAFIVSASKPVKAAIAKTPAGIVKSVVK